MSSDKYHWNWRCRKLMNIPLVAEIIAVVYLLILPLDTVWGLSWFENGGRIFTNVSQVILVFATLIPFFTLHQMSPIKKGEQLSIILPQTPKSLYLYELRYWVVRYSLFVLILIVANMWFEQRIIKHMADNFLTETAVDLTATILVLLMSSLPFMLTILYTYAKQKRCQWLISLGFTINMLLIPQWLIIKGPYHVDFIGVLGVIVFVLISLIVWKLNWINEMYQ